MKKDESSEKSSNGNVIQLARGIIYYSALLLLSFYLIYFTPIAYPIQLLEAWLVYTLWTFSGVPASLNSNGVSISLGAPVYRAIYISAQCTALFEMVIVFLSILFIHRRLDRMVVRDGAILGAIIFSENLIRIYLTYDLISWYGYRRWAEIHYVWWYYGHFILILALILLWAYLRGYVFVKKDEE